MKYNRARLISNLVNNLDRSWDTSNYVAAIKPDDPTDNEWCVYLYSRGNYPHHLIELAGFACALENLASDIHYTMSEYDKATYGEEMVPAIQIW